jgi:hypothetical protein
VPEQDLPKPQTDYTQRLPAAKVAMDRDQLVKLPPLATSTSSCFACLTGTCAGISDDVDRRACAAPRSPALIVGPGLQRHPTSTPFERGRSCRRRFRAGYALRVLTALPPRHRLRIRVSCGIWATISAIVRPALMTVRCSLQRYVISAMFGITTGHFVLRCVSGRDHSSRWT